MLVQAQQGCLQQTVLRTVRIESIVFYEAALLMGMVELDLLREFHFAFEECCVFLNGFIAAFQASFYNEEHFINKHSDEHLKDVHLFDIDTGSLQTLVRRIPKRFQHLNEQSLGFGSGSIIFNCGKYLGQDFDGSTVAQCDNTNIILRCNNLADAFPGRQSHQFQRISIFAAVSENEVFQLLKNVGRQRDVTFDLLSSDIYLGTEWGNI